MWDVKTVGEEAYVAAKPITDKTQFEYFQFIGEIILDVFRVLLFSLLYLIDQIKSIFITKKCKNISGKLALVSGGGNGLGKLISLRLAKEKCNIAVVDLDFDAALKTVDEIKALGVNAKAYKCDVADCDAVEKLKNDIKIDMGIVSLLINNAGLIPYVSIREKHWTDIEKILKVNIHSHFWTVRVFLDDMIKHKDGHIVGISSLAGIFSGPYMIAYSATKHAVNAMMSSLADELLFDGHSDYVKTTCICPYFINTRKEVMDFINLRFPPLQPEWTADKIVNAILEEKELIIISKLSTVLQSCQLLPKCVQRICGEILFKVRGIRNLHLHQEQ